jgi:hypothetical protein
MEEVFSIEAAPLRAKSIKFDTAYLKLTNTLPKHLTNSVRDYLNESQKQFEYSTENLRIIQRSYVLDGISKIYDVIQALEDELAIAKAAKGAFYNEPSYLDAPVINKSYTLYRLYSAMKSAGHDTGDVWDFRPEAVDAANEFHLWEPLKSAIIATQKFIEDLESQIETAKSNLGKLEATVKTFDARICAHTSDIAWLQKEGLVDNLPHYVERPAEGVTYGKSLGLTKDELKWIRPDADGNRNANLLALRWKQADALRDSTRKSHAALTVKREQENRLTVLRHKFNTLFLKDSIK